MANRLVILTLIILCYGMAGTSAHAQAQMIYDICPKNTKLICTLPEVFGAAGLQQHVGPLMAGPGSGHAGGHFESSFITSLGSLNSALGSQLTLLPIGSPGSGLVYVYDPTLKTFTASTEDLGPILTERANTTGRHKIRFGFTYQRFSFSSLDGSSLHNLPASFTHVMDPGSMMDSTGGTGGPTVPIPSNVNCTVTPMASGDSNIGLCGFVRDRIDTVSDIKLILNQYTAIATFGLTSRIDASIVIPVINVDMTVSSVAKIINNSNTNDHQFNPGSPAIATCTGTPCLQASFANLSSATGIGDVVLRGKGVVWSGERAAVSVGADLRLPTGDEQNFLGSGTVGFTPFAVFSYAARVSPHVNVGYEVNGSSFLAGQIKPPMPVGPPNLITTPSVFTKAHLPNQFVYAGGVDVAVLPKRLAGTFDLIGQRVFNAQRSTVSTQMFLGPCTPSGQVPQTNSNTYCSTAPTTPTDPQSTLINTTGSFNILNASLGAKVRISDKFIVFGNALIKLDDGGLRARVVPLVGGSFSF